jgi:SAM-dependent methyltransferase
MPTRQEREAAFHDEAFASGLRAPAERFWAANRKTDERYQELLGELGNGRRVLEYGCGEGSFAFALARNGAEVVGIDISPVGIEHAREEARREGVDSQTEFRVMDAMDLDLPDDEFDLVCGRGILHHLELDSALREIARVLKPGGNALFSEPLGHNPAINLYRRMTPEMRTPDEHPLVTRDFDLAHRYFGDVQLEFFTLSTLAAVPLRNRRAYPRAIEMLDRFDQMLFRSIPFLRRHAWIVLMRLSEPSAALPA